MKNPPAFPRPGFCPPSGMHEDCDINDSQRGMDLRDYFAGLAMQGLIHDILIDQHWENVMIAKGLKAEEFQGFLAHLAYGTADAMLAERGKAS